jgi:NAD(P)H-dependent flavin oxidoreductase YrpB (nitropropane dioxygenase family)
MHNEICEKLGIEFPIFAFSHCRDVVAAVSKAGGIGVLGALAFSPEQLEMELNWLDNNTGGKPYGVDIVIPKKYVGRDEGDFKKEDLENMITDDHKKWIEDLLTKHGVPPLPETVEEAEGLLGWSASGGRAHLEVAMNHPIKLIVNALGPPPEDVVSLAHDKGILVAALVGSVKHAEQQKKAGVDIIVASGYEAGGHTGEITSMILWPQVAEAVHPTPVLAAGGVGNGKGMAAAMALGCQGVWTGSVWLTAAENDYQPALVDKLLAATSEDTLRSRAISGKPARMLKTPYTDAWESKESPGYLPMPLQYMATADASQRIYRHAQSGEDGAAALLGTPVGQIVGTMNQIRPAKAIVAEMVSDYVEIIGNLQGDLDKLAE